MYHLKLCKGLSYYGMGGAVKATRQEPDVYTEDKATADTAVASGFFTLVGEVDAPWPPAGEVLGHLDPEQLESMTVPDLKKLAADMGVDLKGLTVKADIIAAIAAVEVSAPDVLDAETLAGMELDELTAYAAEKGISLEGVPSTKEDVLEAISVAQGGSYTMLDLMRE